MIFVWWLVCQRCGSTFHLEAREPNGPRGWAWLCLFDGGALNTLRVATRRAA